MQQSSGSIGSLAAALARAQVELINPEKSMVASIRPDDGTAEQIFRYAPLSIILGAKIYPVAAECAPRSRVVELAEATCVRGADFHPNKPNNLLANESLLSVGGDG